MYTYILYPPIIHNDNGKNGKIETSGNSFGSLIFQCSSYTVLSNFYDWSIKKWNNTLLNIFVEALWVSISLDILCNLPIPLYITKLYCRALQDAQNSNCILKRTSIYTPKKSIGLHPIFYLVYESFILHFPHKFNVKQIYKRVLVSGVLNDSNETQENYLHINSARNRL